MRKSLSLIIGTLLLSACGGVSPGAGALPTPQNIAPAMATPSVLATAGAGPVPSPSLAPASVTPIVASPPQLPSAILPSAVAPIPSAAASPPPAAASPALAQPCLPADLPLAPAVPPITAAPPISRTVGGPIARFGYQVVASYPHDRGAFTEGLVYEDGALYEGTGLNGKSELRQVELASGQPLRRCALPNLYFGEGVTVLGDKIYQLTWQTQIGFVYDKASFRLLRSFSYPSEGWGLAHDGQRLIMSDGSATIHFLDPATLQETSRIEVYDDHGPVTRLNELEYMRGEIFANVWQTDLIARIDPRSGALLGWIDLAGLLHDQDRGQPVDVLNGIAYDAAGDRLFVTGKLWPKLFEIRLVPDE